MFSAPGTEVACLPPLKPICRSGRAASEVNLLSEKLEAKQQLKRAAQGGLFPQDCLPLMLHTDTC